MMILLLPGADGTGLLFKPFIEVIKAFIDKENVTNLTMPKLTLSTAIINLNHDKMGNPLKQTLSLQAARIENEYDGQSVIIIAESYSGLLAYELLMRQRLEITQMVFVASFLSMPSKLAPIAARLKPKYLSSALRYTPERIWGRVVFGKWQNHYLRSLFMDAMQQTPDDLLQQRLEIIATAKVPTVKTHVPCLYLQGKQDNLVAAKNIAPFSQLFTNFECQILEGTHFLLQTNPEAVWEGVQEKILTTVA